MPEYLVIIIHSSIVDKSNPKTETNTTHIETEIDSSQCCSGSTLIAWNSLAKIICSTLRTLPWHRLHILALRPPEPLGAWPLACAQRRPLQQRINLLPALPCGAPGSSWLALSGARRQPRRALEAATARWRRAARIGGGGARRWRLRRWPSVNCWAWTLCASCCALGRRARPLSLAAAAAGAAGRVVKR
eukprot:SAG11_NODE_1885_length_4119_cov_7.094527_5_plen_189_part_00